MFFFAWPQFPEVYFLCYRYKYTTQPNWR